MMPKLPEHLKPIINPPKKKPYINPDARYECPICKSVHHFNSVDGCHNPKCDYTAELVKIR